MQEAKVLIYTEVKGKDGKKFNITSRGDTAEEAAKETIDAIKRLTKSDIDWGLQFTFSSFTMCKKSNGNVEIRSQ